MDQQPSNWNKLLILMNFNWLLADSHFIISNTGHNTNADKVTETYSQVSLFFMA